MTGSRIVPVACVLSLVAWLSACSDSDWQDVCQYEELPPREALLPPREAEALCQQAGTLISGSSLTDTTARAELTGRWVCCDVAPATTEFTQLPCDLFGRVHDGIELRSDGTWSLLEFSGDELVARNNGPGDSGEWTVTRQYGYGSYCVVLMNLTGGPEGSPFWISRSPSGLLFRLESSGMHRYVATLSP